MKKYLLYLILFFCACSSPIQDENKNIISKHVMKNILKDMILMESINKTYSSRIDNKNFFGDKFIYQKYNVNDSLFIKSINYYAQNPKIYSKIYESILLDMEKMVDSIEILVKIQEHNDDQKKLFLSNLNKLIESGKLK
jgi:hypothetical protein|tara:strand:- start:278 stop:694 length:417 start_codon:yes stop_codon:yes gene_type:complete